MTLATFDGRVPLGPAPESAEPSAVPMRPCIARIARRLAVPALALLLAAPPPAAGQDAGAVDRAIANQNIILRRYKPQRQEGTVEATVVDQQTRTPPERAAAIRLTLRSVTVEGNDAVADSALAPIWAGRIGTTVSLADLYGFAAAVEGVYRGRRQRDSDRRDPLAETRSCRRPGDRGLLQPRIGLLTGDSWQWTDNMREAR